MVFQVVAVLRLLACATERERSVPPDLLAAAVRLANADDVAETLDKAQFPN